MPPARQLRSRASMVGSRFGLRSRGALFHSKYFAVNCAEAVFKNPCLPQLNSRLAHVQLCFVQPHGTKQRCRAFLHVGGYAANGNEENYPHKKGHGASRSSVQHAEMPSRHWRAFSLTSCRRRRGLRSSRLRHPGSARRARPPRP